MEKKRLTDGMMNVTGMKMVADREVRKTTLIYRPRGSYAEGMDVNQQVYELMIIAAYDQLEMGEVVYQGDWTAAELAGTVGCLHLFCENVKEDWEEYDCIVIQTKTFGCSFHPGQMFQQMAEWEGVMNLAPKNYRRFHCEGKEMPQGAKVKVYQRCLGYKPRTISLAAENQRIAKKFEVLGAMARSLTSEGMRKALSVLTAIKSIKKLHGYDMADLAGRLLRRKLWRDYGRDQYQQTVCYTASDFEHGPEVWKVVDEEYVKQLMAYFRQVLADSPAPEWIKKGDMVQMKDQEKQPKKWQGKLSVWRVTGSLDYYKDAIEWFADVCTTKGKHDAMTRRVDLLEPWVEPEKPGKKTAKKKTAKARPRSGRQPDHGWAGNATTVGQAAKAQGEGRCDTAPHTTSQEPTLAERLREVLLGQIKQAA